MPENLESTDKYAIYQTPKTKLPDIRRSSRSPESTKAYESQFESYHAKVKDPKFKNNSQGVKGVFGNHVDRFE
jgi:hypothetical protein